MKKFFISVLSAMAGGVVGAIITGKVIGSSIEKVQKTSDKYFSLFLLMNRWIEIRQEGKKLSDFLIRNGYRKIAVYGMSYAGETFINELKCSDVSVVYGIDKNADSIYADVNIVLPEDDLKPVDAIVVTAITFFNEIEEQLAQKVKCPILSLEDILYEV